MTDSPTSVVAVVGPQRSGTSCVAGVLSHLGIPMGKSWQEGPGNPKGFFEDRGLRRIHVQSFYEIWDDRRKNTFAERVDLLRQWLQRRSRDGPLIGGKNPHMCIMVPEMCEAWPRWVAIATDRPAHESARSMKRLKHLPLADKIKGIQKAINQRDRDLSELLVPTLRVPYAELIRDPQTLIAGMIDFLGIHPTEAQIAQAVAHVDPALNHFSK